MSGCQSLIENASAGAGPALRAVDCLANETAAAAFGRLFGTQGALLPALTILLTLFIAFFAIGLLTGRSRIGISALTPRMMTLGVVLTLATSWLAWQSVVWNLAVGAPDQIAGVLLGAKGSATQLFADRIDMVFAAIAEAGEMNGSGSAQGAAAGSFTPPNLMWLGALLLLLGTVGILVTARIALAVLMAVGPVFVIFALFSGTRGLTAGWLRGLALTAVTPLFVVVGGSMILELLVPVVVNLRGAEGIDPRAAMALFLIAAVHIALMAMVIKVSGTIVSAWQVFGLASGGRDDARGNRGEAPASALPAMANAAPAPAAAHSRTAPVVAAASADAPASGGHSASAPATARGGRTIVNHVQPGATAGLPPLAPRRARGIGSRFAARPTPMREMMR